MLKLSVAKETGREYLLVEQLFSTAGQHLLYCVNTPIKDFNRKYEDAIKEVPVIESQDVAELVLSSGLFSDWNYEAYGVNLGYEFYLKSQTMWLESVLREFYFKGGNDKSSKLSIAKMVSSMNTTQLMPFARNDYAKDYWEAYDNINMVQKFASKLKESISPFRRISRAVYSVGIGTRSVAPIFCLAELTKLFKESQPFEFDPEQSVYQSWDDENNILSKSQKILEGVSGSKDLEDALTELTKDMSDNEAQSVRDSIKSLRAANGKGNGIAKLEDDKVVFADDEETIRISTNIDDDDSLSLNTPGYVQSKEQLDDYIRSLESVKLSSFDTETEKIGRDEKFPFKESSE